METSGISVKLPVVNKHGNHNKSVPRKQQIDQLSIF